MIQSDAMLCASDGYGFAASGIQCCFNIATGLKRWYCLQRGRVSCPNGRIVLALSVLSDNARCHTTLSYMLPQPAPHRSTSLKI